MADLTISVEIDGSKVKGGAENVNRAVKSIGDEAEKSAKRTSSLAKVDYSGAIRQLREYGSQIQNFGGQISGFGQTLTFGLSAPIAAVAALGIRFNATKEQSLVAFGVLLKDGEKAKKLYADLQKFAADTPFEMPGIAQASKSLLAFGVAQEQILPTLKSIGDIASGTGVPLTELAEIYGKAKVQGRLFAEDINQLTGRGVPIIQELAKQFGVSETEVKKLVETGKVGFPQLEKAFQDLTGAGGQFAGMMEAQSKTFTGRFSTLMDSINTGLGKVTEGLFNQLSAVMPSVISLVEQSSTAFSNLSPSLQVIIPVAVGVAAALGPVLIFLGILISSVGSVVGAVGTLIPIFAAVGGAIAGLGGFIVSFIGLIGQAGLIASFSALASVLGGTVVGAIGAFLTALAPIAVGVAVVVAVVGSLIGIGVALYAAWQSNFGGLRDFTNEVFNTISQTINQALASIQELWATYGGQIVSTATNTFNSIIEFVRPIMTELVAFMRETWQAIVESAGPLLTQLVALVKTNLTGMIQVVRVILAAIAGFWSDHGEQIKSIVSAVWTILKTIVLAGIRQIANVITLVLAVINGDWAAAWDAFKNIVQTGVNASVTILKSLGNLVVSALAFVATRMFGIGRDIIQGLVNGISSGGRAVYDAAANIASGVISKFKSVFATQSPSRITTEIGEFVSEGLAAGIESKESRVVAAAKKVADAAIKQFRDAQTEFSKLAGASPETQRTIQQANQTTDATSAQQEIIKLRGELGVNTDLSLPTDVAGTVAELKYLQDRKKLIEETIPPHQQLEEIQKRLDESRLKQIESFDKLKSSIESSGASELLRAQKEVQLLGVTDDFEKQRIENYYELLRLRQQMSNDGFGEDQIAEAVELQKFEQARVLEWVRIKQLKQQQIDLDKKINDEQLKAAEEAKKKFESDANALAGSLSRIFGAGIKDGFKGFLKQALEELKSFGTTLLNDVLSQISKSLSRFILGKLNGGGSSSGGGIGGFLNNLFGGGSGGSGGGGSSSGGIFGAIRNLFGGGSGGGGSSNILGDGISTPNQYLTNGRGGSGIGLTGGIALGGAAANIIGGLIGGRTGSFISNIGTGAALGAQIGSIVPGIGTLIGAGIGAVGGFLASLFGGDPKRKKDKKENLPALQKGFTDALQQLRSLGADKNAFYNDPDATIAKAVELRGQIASGFGIKFESKKYQKQAQQEIASKLLEADNIIAELNKLKTRALRAKDIDSRLETNFASGVYLGRDDQMREMLNYRRRNGMLSGIWSGRDELPSMLAKGEMVLNPSQISQVILNSKIGDDDPFRNANIPGYATGIYLSSSPAAVPPPNSSTNNFSPQSDEKQQIVVQIYTTNSGMVESDIENVMVKGFKKDAVQVELVKAVEKGRSRN